MQEGKALLIMSLVARRSTAWMHDIIASRAINRGEVSEDAMRRFAKDIADALAIIDEPDRGNYCEPETVNQQSQDR